MSSGTGVHSASRIIRAAPEAIWHAFVDPRVLVRWLPPTGMTGRIDAFDPREGGEYRITLTYTEGEHPAPGKSSAHTDVAHGRFLEWLPNRRIVQSVEFDSGEPAFQGAMRMTWELERVAHGTRVTITAEHVPAGIRRSDHEAGFAATLDKLAACVEGGSV